PLQFRQMELSNLDKNYSIARISSFLLDREKNLWLGWFQRGLVFIPSTNKQFEFWRVLELEEADKHKINAVTTDANGKIWYSVEGLGVLQADSGGHVIQTFPDLRNITQLQMDDQGVLWFLSYQQGLGKIIDGQDVRFLNLFA